MAVIKTNLRSDLLRFFFILLGGHFRYFLWGVMFPERSNSEFARVSQAEANDGVVVLPVVFCVVGVPANAFIGSVMQKK